MFGVYTCILDCGYGLAIHMLGNTSNGKHCGVADTHLVEGIIPILLVKVEGDVEAR